MSIYRTRNATNLNTIKNSISDILPNKSADSLERTKFEQSQVKEAFISWIKYHYVPTIHAILIYLYLSMIKIYKI
jgi:hypothetical protein